MQGLKLSRSMGDMGRTKDMMRVLFVVKSVVTGGIKIWYRQLSLTQHTGVHKRLQPYGRG